MLTLYHSTTKKRSDQCLGDNISEVPYIKVDQIVHLQAHVCGLQIQRFPQETTSAFNNLNEDGKRV